MTDGSEIGVHLSLKNGTATEQEKQNTKEGPIPFPCLHRFLRFHVRQLATHNAPFIRTQPVADRNFMKRPGRRANRAWVGLISRG